MPTECPNDDKSKRKQHFATTCWSRVVAAGGADSDAARVAFSELCQAYWHPLYAYIRGRGQSTADAQDLTQAFFTRLFEKHSLEVADRERGKFRSFLLASLDHFLSNEFDRARAQKRGGGRSPISLDFAGSESRVNLEPSHRMTAERLFERHWALSLLDIVVKRLEAEYREAGKARHFESLRNALAGDRDRPDYAAIAQRLDMTSDAARQAAHRMRKRYRTLLREEVGRTVADPAEVDDELAALFRALGD